MGRMSTSRRDREVLRGVSASAWLWLAACEPTDDARDATSRDATTQADAETTCVASEVASVLGRVIDERGSPIASARPQLCLRLAIDGRLVCLEPPFTDDTGRFVLEVPSELRCIDRGVMRVLVSGGPYATSYCPLEPTRAIEGTLTLDSPIELTAVARVPLPPRGDPAVSREVVLGDVLAVEVVPDRLGSESDYARLGAARVVPARSCVPEARALDGLIAMTPEGRVDGAFRVLASGLAEGTRVELFVIGGLDTRLPDGSIVEEGSLVRLGEGRVDVDGTITPEPTVLLPQLGWLGWSVR